MFNFDVARYECMDGNVHDNVCECNSLFGSWSSSVVTVRSITGQWNLMRKKKTKKKNRLGESEVS